MWKFDENFIETNLRLKNNDNNLKIVQFERVIEHHKSAITSIKYDGINSIISSNKDG